MICVILRILYKWNYVVHYLWNDLYPPQHNALKIHPNCTLWSLYLTSIWYYRYTMVCLTLYLLKDILVVSNFWLLQIKLLYIFVYRFLCEYTFSFLLGVELLGVIEAPRLIIWRATRVFLFVCFSRVAAVSLTEIYSSRESVLWVLLSQPLLV